MTNASVLVDYMAALDTLLVSPSAEMRSSTSAVRQAPFGRDAV